MPFSTNSLFSALLSIPLPYIIGFHIIRWIYLRMMSLRLLRGYAGVYGLCSTILAIRVYPAASEWIRFQLEVNALTARVGQFEQMIDCYNLLMQEIDTGVSSTDEYLRCEALLLSIEVEENLLFDAIRTMGMTA